MIGPKQERILRVPPDASNTNGITNIAVCVSKDMSEYSLLRDKIIKYLIDECGLQYESLQLHADEPAMMGIPRTWADLFRSAPVVVTGDAEPPQEDYIDDGGRSMGSWSHAQSTSGAMRGSRPETAGHGPVRGPGPWPRGMLSASILG